MKQFERLGVMTAAESAAFREVVADWGGKMQRKTLPDGTTIDWAPRLFVGENGLFDEQKEARFWAEVRRRAGTDFGGEAPSFRRRRRDLDDADDDDDDADDAPPALPPRICNHPRSAWQDSPPAAGWIVTTCATCGGFVGRRPAGKQQRQRKVVS